MKKILIAATLLNFLPIAIAGPQDKWVYVGSAGTFDGIALLLGIGAFGWVYIIYRDLKDKSKPKRK